MKRLSLILVLAMAMTANAQVFTEDFSGDLSQWTQTGVGFGDLEIRSDVAQASAPYMRVPYTTGSADFSSTVSDFEVNWKWNYESDPADHAFMYVTNATGEQGYGVRFSGWNAVVLGKYDKPGQPVYRANALPTEYLGDHIGLGGTAYDLPFYDMKLTLDGAGLLSLYTTTKPGTSLILRSQVTDTSFTSFSRIYFTSNGDYAQFVDEITVIPEPASMALLAVGGLLLRRRRSRS